jgi:hypothetical protein
MSMQSNHWQRYPVPALRAEALFGGDEICCVRHRWSSG